MIVHEHTEMMYEAMTRLIWRDRFFYQNIVHEHENCLSKSHGRKLKRIKFVIQYYFASNSFETGITGFNKAK